MVQLLGRQREPFSFRSGSVLVAAILILGVMLFLAGWYVSFTLTGSLISRSQTIATKTYYLAEAGINQAIWKLKNDEIATDGDSPWKICFTTTTVGCPDCSSWQDSFIRNYNAGSTTTVSIKNLQCGQGEIIATSTVGIGNGKFAQRVVKVKVIKSFGSLTEDSPIFAGSPSGESTIQSSVMNVYNGNLFSNNNINIKYWSTINVYDNPTSASQEGQVLANGNVNLTLSTLNSSSTCSKNMCTEGICEKCPVDFQEMPAIDFDSSDPNSYKSKAQKAENEGQCSVIGKDSEGSVVSTTSKCIFSENEFEDLLWQVGKGGTLILEYKSNGHATSTYYIDGGLDLKGERLLEIQGILVAGETVNIGESFCWRKGWQFDCGFDQVKITDPGKGIPSGILTKGKMNFGPYSSFGDVDITGLVYSQDEMRLTSLPHKFKVVGGIIGRKFSLTSAFQSLDIYLDNDIIREGVWGGSQPPSGTGASYSPVVTVDHWEESY
ncbi:hypothetical protein J7J81_00820 [bacterium]|nr:hypothetical protein [bacterium]